MAVVAAGAIIVILAAGWLLSGYRIEVVAPTTGADAAQEWVIAHRSSERVGLVPSTDEWAIAHRASERVGLVPSTDEWAIAHRASERAGLVPSTDEWAIAHRASERESR